MDDALSFEFQQLKISVLNKLVKINSFSNESISPCKEEISKNNLLANSKKDISDPLPKQSDPQFQDLLKILELQRRKQVVSNVQARLKKVEDFTVQQELNKQKQWLEKQQEFVEDIQQKEQNIFQALEEYDKKSLNSHAQLALYYKNLELRRQTHENEIKRREQEKQIIYGCMDKIKKLQPEFRSVYEEILITLRSCTKHDELRTALLEEFKLLKLLPNSFDEIINKCKNAKVTEEDVEKAQGLFLQLHNIEKKISETVDAINKKNEQEKLAKVLPPPPPADNKEIAVESVSRNVSNSNIERYVSLENLEMYTKLMDFFEKYLDSFKNLANDGGQKQFVLDCKKAINIPVNSLSGVNSEHILDKYTKLYRLLKGQDVIITDKRINASIHPEGISFCTNLLAKRFVLQSDLIISSNSESAFCYATVIVSLWNEFPVFGQLLLAYFYKVCPYLVPYNIVRQVGESDEEFYKRQGYQYNNGQIEKQDKFLKRMTGVMRLYAAIMVVKPKKGHVNVYNIQNGWRWLASTLKLEAEMDITATLVHTFLESAGFELETYYGRLFQKMIRIIVEKFLPSCREKCTGGAVTRLELLMTEYFQKRKFETPDGYMGYTFW